MKTKKIPLLQFIKYFLLCFIFLFSLNTFAVGDLIGCGSHNNLTGYNSLHESIKKNPNDAALFYSLAITSLCLNKKDEGMGHLQTASDKGHIAATWALGSHYKHNQTFNSAEKRTKGLENLNNAIHYYRKAADLIAATSNYPEGATDDMKYIESTSYTSYSVFRFLPDLYFRGYVLALKDIYKGESSYTDTLEVLDHMGATAVLCVERPALYVWNGKKNIVYKAQQIKCTAHLNFAEAAYNLEKQRIQAAQNCEVPLSECLEHKELRSQISQLAKNMHREITSAPQIH